MNTFDDQPLGASVDVTPALPEPVDFDLESWLSGVRPTRRAVRLYGRADVIARMEEISATIEALPEPHEGGDTEEMEPLLEEFEQLRQAFEASARWFVLEARSQEWVQEFRRNAKRELGVKKDPDERQQIAILLGQMAEQIVIPVGVTVEHLERLHATNAGELNKLVVAMTLANEQIAESAKVLRLDFSPRRSAAGPD